ncbi:complement C3-like isoform X1 [Poecilia latipinna]|uniref:complement C3-like isoform X1 n=1 Tax=Poecilia latipinna TaxID=48699 RepID=UPI00072E08DE|nr:PREDICTED: complement C3-like isoform X1 [Poecilia latipinna]
MRRTLLLQLASLVFASWAPLADGANFKVMSAPNLMRVGTAENIFVECQDCTGGDMEVRINVMNHPTKNKKLTGTSVILNRANNFQGFGKVTIPTAEFSKDPTMRQYVYLQANFPDKTLEKVVLVSLQSGYIFIQMDKTLYTPNSRVFFRLFALTSQMEPVDRNDQNQDVALLIEIMTPEEIIIPLDVDALNSGMFSGGYQLSEIASPGLWKVVAKFQSNPQQKYYAEFEVKEYVLPSFEVKLVPVDPFFYVDSEQLTININAAYLFGKEVFGTAYVMFGIMEGNVKRSIPHSLTRVPVVNGAGQVTLQRNQITQTFPGINDLVGRSIFVSVTVLTESDNEMVEAELRDIQIVMSPYKITLTRTPKFFKPGMSFDVVVEVVHPDDSPAENVPVVVSPGDMRGITAGNGMARVTINIPATDSNLRITAKTDKGDLLPSRQAATEMEAFAYLSSSKSYIHIAIDTAEVKVGDLLKINLILNNLLFEKDITYLILSRGHLLKYERYRNRGQALISQILPITKEMLPSFRIIAYYHSTDNEVVSDSVWVDVKDSCMGSLTLESKRPLPSYEPRRMFTLKVTGDPGAAVGLVAVDKGVYVLNNKHRLTQKKVWDEVEHHDIGCTPGGGSNSMNVFFDAGLLFESSTAAGTANRQELKCKTTSRQKRDTTAEEVTTTLSESDDSYMDTYEIVSRSMFPESWLWIDIQLPVCPAGNPNCESTSLERHIPLRDSMTTWQFTGISLSRTLGLCVGEPLEVIVRKEFFIDLQLPYSAVRGEQLEIKAILHNYSPDPITVRVELIEEENVCSVASKRGKYRQEVRVGPQTTRSVPFIIIPMKEGKRSIEVKAAVKDSSLNDGVVKMLRVVPDGVLTKVVQSVTLNPAVKGQSGAQVEILNSNISRKDLVPNSPTSTYVSVTGREQVSGLVENPISGRSMGTLIYQPGGAGEANMIQMTLPVIATIYLDITSQWEAVGLNKRNEALQHIRTGYNNELRFRKGDGSFSIFANHGSSTWLTAYVTKVFSLAYNLIAVQNEHICGAVKYLILNAQQPDGMFKEVGKVYHGEMQGDVLGTDSDASMTAFCLIALQESRTICGATLNSLPSSIPRAVTYLERRLPNLANPYAVAITSYALANENKLNREILYKFASPELNHWPISGKQTFTQETTGYALLALVRAQHFEDARPIVRWFNQQQKVGGGYGSTQATIIVYQAVAEYWTKAKEPEYDLNVDILLPGRSRPNKFNFNRDNLFATRTSKVSYINQDVKVTASGIGEATVKMVSLYYTIPKEKESDCQKFNLSVQLIPVSSEISDEDRKTYKLKIDVLYKDRDRDATMSILDIGLLTGFTVDTQDLDLLSTGRARTIARYEMNTVLSEKGSLIIYLDKVSHTRPEEISFRIHQTLKVGVLQPAAVSVYEYYDQAPCVKLYHPERQNGKLCKSYECICVEERCNMQKRYRHNTEERIAKICENTETSKTDFAYKATVEETDFESSADFYIMRIVEVIKEGPIDADAVGKLRTFFSRRYCREALNVEKGKTYLIMGSSNDISGNNQTQIFQYELGEKTWIEYWPSEAECRLNDYQPTCMGFEEMADQYAIFGCQQ